nr:WYL domain-containing protein [Thiomonas sp. X19]
MHPPQGPHRGVAGAGAARNAAGCGSSHRQHAPWVLHLAATVQDTWQLRWWLLSHADQAVVIAPKSLQRDLALRIAEAAELYGV